MNKIVVTSAPSMTLDVDLTAYRQFKKNKYKEKKRKILLSIAISDLK
jgi:hypothetical protein